MQSKPLKFNPICGTEFKTDECFAGTFRTGSVRQWFFNPWTGAERASQDVVGDPHGELIYDGVEPVEAYDTPAAAREALHDWAERENNPSFPYPQNKPETVAHIANGVVDAMFGQSPARAQATGLTEVLADRGAKYGKFDRHAAITQHLKRIMYTYKARTELADDQTEALDMIAHKIGRILNGDPNYADSWIDIAGYAKLVANRLDGVAR